MRCLLVSDLHYTLKQFDWVLSQADAFDLIVIAGDHLDISSAVDLNAQIVVVLTYLKRLRAKTRIFVCSGNHDLDARNGFDEQYARWITRARDYGVPTDEDSPSIDGALFTICPWWDGPKSRERVGELIARDSRKSRTGWVWVYHSPPDESPTSWGGRQHFGDAQLVEWIRRYGPDLVFTGHIHQSPFRGGSWVDRIGDTWVFNPGRQIGPCPTHIILDTERQSALWFSLAGNEAVALDQPLTRPVPELTELPAWLR
ncbi:MAG: metallophosphoesterase [Chromatiaceae bacterium]|jgi:Icc-related predicted phosphoesterase|nr:metallophosphoesterase [Chromatiaceae bacterium]